MTKSNCNHTRTHTERSTRYDGNGDKYTQIKVVCSTCGEVLDVDKIYE